MSDQIQGELENMFKSLQSLYAISRDDILRQNLRREFAARKYNHGSAINESSEAISSTRDSWIVHHKFRVHSDDMVVQWLSVCLGSSVQS